MTMYQVVEICKAYDPWFGPGKGWIYYSKPVMCYRIALRLAIIHDKKLPWNKSWVEARSHSDSIPDQIPAKTNLDKFKSIVSNQTSGWQERAEWRARNDWWAFPLFVIKLKYLRIKRSLKD